MAKKSTMSKAADAVKTVAADALGNELDGHPSCLVGRDVAGYPGVGLRSAR